MYTYQITDVARREHEKDQKIVEEAADVLGIDQENLWGQAVKGRSADFHTKDSVLLYMLASEFGQEFHSPGHHHKEIKEESLMEFDKDQIQVMVDEEYLERIDPDEDLIQTIDEAFENFDHLFIMEKVKEKARGFTPEVKTAILTEDSKGDDNRDYPSLLRIRDKVLRALDVISPRNVRITEE